MYLEDIWRSSRVKIHRENDGSSRWWQKISRSSNIRSSRRPLTGAVARDSMGRHFFPESRVEGSRCVPLDQRQSAVKQWRAAQRGFYCIAERAKFQRAQCGHPPPRHAVKSPSNTFSALKRHLPSILPSLPAFLQNWMRIFPSTISLFPFFLFFFFIASSFVSFQCRNVTIAIRNRQADLSLSLSLSVRDE